MITHIINLVKCLFGLHAWHFIRTPEGFVDQCQHCEVLRK